MTDLEPVFILVEGEPRGKGRPKFARQGGFVRVYTDDKTMKYEALIQLEARRAMKGRPIIAGPVKIVMEIHHSIRPSWTKAKRAGAAAGEIAPTIKCDFDNVAKVFCDALNGCLWVDDTQVIEARITKHFSETPCVSILITPLDLQSA